MVRKVAPLPEKFLTVGEAAAELGVTRATLRNWDKAGKLTPRRHPINGYRMYATTEIEALKNAITGEKK
jgi:DNA-binding transcriptional MerR regulator